LRDDRLILVDEDDRPVGMEEELICHQGDGILHRAFTIIIINANGELLLQRRSASKLLWPLCWETTCSGHPRVGEDLEEAAAKRLAEELGFSTGMRDVGRFIYKVAYEGAGIEWEVCHLLVGSHDGATRPDAAEVAEVRHVALAALQAEIAAGREKNAPWLEPALDLWVKVVK
jgi:isopentenyl-diphosphate delta-isomerase